MGVQIADLDILPLTALEKIGPKGYLRYVFTYDLGEDYDLEKAASALRAGLEATKRRIPTMACEAVPDPDSKQGGVFKLQRIPEGEAEDLVVKDLRGPGAFPMPYKQLKEHMFPVSAFDAETICRRGVWVAPGERVPISLVQANFIPGGLVLSWCILHMAGDSNAFNVWARIWADECRLAQGLDVASPYDVDPKMVSDRQLVMKASGKNPGKPEDHPEYFVLPFVPPGAPPKMLSQDHRGQVFFFSPESLKALKEDCAPAKATQATEVPWISTNDALSALLWRTLMAVQNPVEGFEAGSEPVSVFNLALDGRLRTEPAVHPQTLGCFLEYVSASAPIRGILGDLNLADMAAMVRKALHRADKHWTDDVAALAESLENVDMLAPTAFLDVPGLNCIISSWIEFDVYGLDWGSALGGKVDSVRCPHVGIINGLQVVLPVPPGGGMEILVGVEKDCLDKLLHEPTWNKYAKAR